MSPLLTVAAAHTVSSCRCSSSHCRTSGVRGFFKGMTAPLLGNAPINAILFAVEHRASTFLNHRFADWSPTIRHLTAGAISGLSQVIISCPAERVKILMQTQEVAVAGSPWAFARLLVRWLCAPCLSVVVWAACCAVRWFVVATFRKSHPLCFCVVSFFFFSVACVFSTAPAAWRPSSAAGG